MSDASSFKGNYDRALHAAATARPALAVTDEMLDQARGNKAIAIISMAARDFLKLTTNGDFPPSYFEKNSKPVDFYNQLALAEKIILMPFLKVRREDGRVVGHEGRHRAGAVVRETGGDAKIRVAVIVADTSSDGVDRAVYYEDSGPPTFKKKYLGLDDVPRVFRGQFRPAEVAVSMAGAERVLR